MPLSLIDTPAKAGDNELVRFGKYTLLTRLATGGMGEVYVAQMTSTAGFEKRVVIKRILPQLARDEQFVRMFLDEARLTAQLNHPNVCQVFDLGEIDGEYYIAMEYLEGLPLARLIETHADAGLDLRLVAGIIIQACEGLHHAHTFRDSDRQIDGIVHRDVSPQNVFVTSPGLIKVLDFGVAKLHREGSTTVTQSTKGKHLYMSPEQVNGEAVDQRSDIFSLATLMHEALCGRPLFGRSTQYLTLQAIVTGDRPRLSDLRGDVPPAIESVMERALSLRRDDRFPTARAMGEALSEALAPHGGPASIIEVAQFFREHHHDELARTAARVKRASAQLSAVTASQSQPAVQVPPHSDPDLDLTIEDADQRYLNGVGLGDADDDPFESNEATIERHPSEQRISTSALRSDPGRPLTPAKTPRPQPISPLPAARALARAPAPSPHPGDAVGLDLDYKPISRGRRYLRWALVATVTAGLAIWLASSSLLQRDRAAPSAATPAEPVQVAPIVISAARERVPAQTDDLPTVAAANAQAVDPLAASDPEATAASAADGDPRDPTAASAAADDDPDDDPDPSAAGDGDVEADPRDGDPRDSDRGDDGQADADTDTSSSPARGDQRADNRRRANNARRAPPGYLTIDASPYASIFVDGKKLGITPLVRVELPSGRRNVRAVASDGRVQRFRLRVRPNATVTRRIRFSDPK
ncbi:MAG: hypothetical protein Tsb0020_03420 [Haliangiales bacterium]